MSVSISDHPIHLQDGIKLNREYMRSQGSQTVERKVFHKETFEISELSKKRENLRNRVNHTVMRSVTSLSDMRAGILKEVREEKGRYDHADVVNACGLSYAKLYSEIEQRHENEQEQYYKADGTLLTKEEEMEWLDMQYEQEVAWQMSCARIAAQGQVFQGHISEMPKEEMEDLEDSFYQARDVYRKLYQESRQSREPLVIQNYVFGNDRMYEMLNRLGI
ncbi:MAG: hypothetical protein K2H40_15940 [Lachnospiraceae bacterium]|nr:hypothetical protein [Lachnospiraceae bacterium]